MTASASTDAATEATGGWSTPLTPDRVDVGNEVVERAGDGSIDMLLELAEVVIDRDDEDAAGEVVAECSSGRDGGIEAEDAPGTTPFGAITD